MENYIQVMKQKNKSRIPTHSNLILSPMIIIKCKIHWIVIWSGSLNLYSIIIKTIGTLCLKLWEKLLANSYAHKNAYYVTVAYILYKYNTLYKLSY